jgi:hypothetical protein
LKLDSSDVINVFTVRKEPGDFRCAIAQILA